MPNVAQIKRLDPGERLPGERDIMDEVRQIFADPDDWMQRPHPLLGARTPRQCIADGEAQAVWDLLRNVRYVGQT